MRPLRPLRSLLAVATLGGMLLSSVGLAATVSPAAADQSLTDYGIYNVTIDAPPGGFSLGDTGKVNFMTYPTDTAAHPLIIKDGESIVRTLTLPSGLSLNGPFGGVASCPGTARNENTAYDDEGKPMDKTFFVDAVCTEFDNGNGTHSYQVSLTYEVDQFFKLSAALRGSIDVKRTGPLPADAEVSITQSLTPDYGPSAGSQQADAVKTNPSPDLTASTITASPATVDLNNSTTSTVTVQARDAAGTPLKVGGALVTGSSKNAAGQLFGSLTPFQYTSDGKYTAQLTSTQSGVATVSYAVAGAAGSNTAKVTFTAGNVDTGRVQTSYSVTPGTRSVKTGEHVVTVNLADRYDNPVPGQAGSLTGTLSELAGASITDFAEDPSSPGTYRAKVTSTEVGTALVGVTWSTRTVNLVGNNKAEFVAGAVDLGQANTSYSVTTGAKPVETGIHTVTVKLVDADGNLVSGEENALAGTLSGLDGATISKFKPITPGVYAAEVTSPSKAGTARVAVTWDLKPVSLRGNGNAEFEAGDVDVKNPDGKTNFTVSTGSRTVDSSSHSVVALLADKFGNPVTGQERKLRASTLDNLGRGGISEFTETAAGQYSATINSSVSGGKLIKVAYDSKAVDLKQNGNDTAVFVAGGVDIGNPGTQYFVTGQDQVVNTGSHWVTVKLADSEGNPVSGQASMVTGASRDDLGGGEVGTFSETSTEGTYTAKITSTVSGLKAITAKFGSSAVQLNGNGTARFVAGDVDLNNQSGKTHFTVSTGSVSVAGGSHSISVLLADKFDNPVTGLAGKLAPSSANDLGTGSISAFTEIAPGEYEAKVTSSVVGGKLITVLFEGKVVGLLSGGNNKAEFVSGGVDTGNAKTKYFVSDQNQVVGSGEHHITVTLADANGNVVSGQAPGISAASANELGGGGIGAFTETTTKGTYTAKITSTVAGPKAITAKFGGNVLRLDGNGTAMFVEDNVDLNNTDGKTAYSVSMGVQRVKTGSHTVTVTLADKYNNAVSGQSAKLNGDTINSLGSGSLTGFTESSTPGTYTATITSTVIGDKVITVRFGNQQVKLQGNDTASFGAGDVDIDNKEGRTNYTVTTGSVSVETGSHSVTVLLADALNNPVTGQAGLLKASTLDDLGSGIISAFKETTAGTYVSNITSSVTGGKVITVSLDGKSVHLKQGGNTTATFIAGGVDNGNTATKYSVSSGDRVVGVGEHTVTVSLADASGNPVSGQEAGIKATTADDLGGGGISAFTETAAKGTYTASISSTVAGAKVIIAAFGADSVTLNGNGTARFVAGDVDLENKEAVTSYTVSRGAVVTGSGQHTISIKLSDKYGNSVSMQSDKLAARTLDPLGSGSISGFSESATPGTYTAKITSSLDGAKVVAASYAGSAISLEKNGNDRAVFAAGGVDVDHAATRYYVSGSQLPVDTGTHTVTVMLTNSNGVPVSGQAAGVAATTANSLGTGGISSFAETAAGVYTATIRSSIPGVKVIGATFGGSTVKPDGNVNAVFVSGSVDRGNTSGTNYRVSTGSREVGTGTHTVTVTLADRFGNPVAGKSASLVASTGNQLGAGFISSFTESATVGVYTARVTSTLSGGKAIKVMQDGGVVSRAGTTTAPANTVALFSSTSVDLSNSASTYQVSTGEQPVVSGKHTVTVTLADSYGNPATGQAAKLKSLTSNPLGTGKVTAFTETKTTGTYVAYVSSSVAGSKVLTARYNGQGISGKKNLIAKFKATVGRQEPLPCTPPRKNQVFADAPVSHKFYKEIDWMHCMGYSTGWRQPSGKPVFKPSDNLSREAMAAFIFRLEAPKTYRAPKVSSFADVNPGDPFYREISWMFEAGLSTGWYDPAGKPAFRPKEKLTREAMAAFIFRLEAPSNYVAPKVSPMADMAPRMKFYREISWMYDVKLSTGNRTVNGKEFLPKDKLSRQAMAAFIYRLVTDYRVKK